MNRVIQHKWFTGWIVWNWETARWDHMMNEPTEERNMANFDDVHRRDLHAADGRLHLGEVWQIALREPLGAPTAAAPRDLFVTVVQFVAMRDGKLEPATESDRFQISEWKRRHRDTPLDWFWLPAGLLQRT